MSSGAMSLKAFCERFSISDNTAYREIAAGRLTAVKVGRRTLISEQAAGDWWESLQSMKRAKREAA